MSKREPRITFTKPDIEKLYELSAENIQEDCMQCTILRDRMIKFIGIKAAAEVQATLQKNPYNPKVINGFEERLLSLKELTDFQCQAGNFDYDGYMHGMANGMRLSVSIMEDKEPDFVDAPEKFLSKKNVEVEVQVEKVTNWALIFVGILTGIFIGMLVAGVLMAHPCSVIDRTYDFTFVSEVDPIVSICKK